MKIKKQYIKSSVLLILAVITFSCSDDYLEVVPKGSLIASKVSDYDRLLDDPALNTLSNALIPMGDEVAAVEPFFSNTDIRNQRLFRWDDEIYNAGQTPDELTNLNAVYTYNKVIAEVMNATEGTDAQKRALLAEAKIGRATSYFALINYYGKPYNAATAATDLGYPIITQSDITLTNFTRNTVEEVYDFILSDITEAIPDLPVVLYKRNRASKIIGEALLGKVLMFKGEFTEASNHLQSAIDLMSSSNLPVELYNYNDTFSDEGAFMPINFFFGPTYPIPKDNKEIIYDKASNNIWAFIQNEIVIKPETAQLYNSSDFRLNFFTNMQAFGFEPVYTKGMLRRYGPFNNQIGVTIPDLILLSIEAKARLGSQESAVADLESFRANRMPVDDASIPADVAADQDKLVKYIFEERIREFSVCGYRWLDMRRLSVDAKYSNLVNYTHDVYDEEGNLIKSHQLKPERLVLRFGQKVKAQNPNLIDNP
ncbi:RagB/SusD family nutrient uptake outer membrane protein [Flavobacterium pectinovorum]|uniref:RagB/SusD family nutrient uptake outer membrane protein n=1 Tax=Flavobacterium pectinovorum TaxID=29533 RepID=UPI001FAE1AB7|nr:RagB/SusD family nutrient uptake outer membrane protein [Flavobacterium pectinovorum]MCI9846845.1 RagB/SusD family nutrient uptake outer membrane protein [Flavobacterium pectinovorum]